MTQLAQLNIGVITGPRRRKEWFERMDEAFTFRYPFPTPDAIRGQAEAPFEDECPA